MSLSDLLGSRADPFAPSEAPIRAELFSVERLEQHAASLAAAQRVSAGPKRGRPLTARLHENAAILSEAHRAIVRATHAQQPITPAAEWLLDNFHVVDEQIREIKDDLPPGFYRKLPKLTDGYLAGFPRVFGIAWALVAHTDSAFDAQKLTRFVRAYQRVDVLTIGELWALAITLRIMLIENLRRLAEAIVARLAASREADTLADRILGGGEPDAANPLPILAQLEAVPWSTAFAVQLAQRLRDRDPETTPALKWLNERLAKENTTTDEIVRKEVQRQSAMNVTVRNIITSMRLISTIDWAEWFESVSLVDSVLRNGSDFDAMDFPTRDLYRRAIEEIAEGSKRPELDVARQAVAKARQAAAKNPGAREGDPGFYLIAKGRPAFEKTLDSRVSLRTRFRRAQTDAGIASYACTIALVTALVLVAGLAILHAVGLQGWPLWLFAILAIVPASEVAVAIVNRVLTEQVGATILPGLELHDGIPDALRTIIVIPTLLTNFDTIGEQIERLEVHYLSNSQENLFFALLSDWTDAETESVSGDQELLEAAKQGVARLNEKHGRAQNSDRFFLFHRRRLWNASEKLWMGWERKRGKLHELNRLLRGAGDTSFLPDTGRNGELPKDVRNVITLDGDTRLPIGTVKRLVGKIAHPLTRPRFDTAQGRVVAGHGILQPRVTPSLPVGVEGSLFQRAFSGPSGLDPYAFAVSDVYQDMFEEGSYVGKGIYDLDIFEAAMEGRIPDNTVLSHDLLEGIFARAGLASDIEVVEEYPSRYDVSAARQHRWVRGDWQLLPWILGWARKTGANGVRTSIPAVGRWKLLDNLRRSLSAPASLLALLAGWFLPLPGAIAWTAFILFTLALPPTLPFFAGIIPRRVGVPMGTHVRGMGSDLALGLLQLAFQITFLAHQAWLMVDAVLRTAMRLVISRRKLLEWVTAAQAARDTRFDRRTLFSQIAASVLFGAAILFAIWAHSRSVLPVAAPFVALWVLSPLAARWASTPPPSRGFLPVSKEDGRTLRLVARRTWRYFETFITAEDNMLPPDNFQETPQPVVAHRTSPTNMGLYLLSILAARDFGWIGTLAAVERLEATLAAMDKLERFRGHFFNWYDTKDLRALEPKYVSSVDSGNLAGHLLALSNAAREVLTRPAAGTIWVNGLEDHLDILRETVAAAADEPANGDGFSALRAAISAFSADLKDAPADPVAMAQRLANLARGAGEIQQASESLQEGMNPERRSEIVAWPQSLAASVQALQHEMDFLLPWAGVIANDKTLSENSDLARMFENLPTLENLPQWHDGIIARLAGDAPQHGLVPVLEKAAASARLLIYRLGLLAEIATTMFISMEFGFLYDGNRQLFSIGYRMSDGALDSNYYDLLASEARLTSFIAIAKGDVPARHWFHLGRTLTAIDGGSGLISWSGSMFEYLMPSLVMRAPSGSLLASTNRLVVQRQEEYGKALGVPWGMSESQYNARDLEQTYQYSSFGVPDLGYKRGLSESTVVAPYATGLAAMIDPAASAQNYRRFASIGARGVYGWYEAVDYTRARLPEGAKFAVINAYMAHHQAMTITGIANALMNGVMRERFHTSPMVQATELLLQERMPRDVALARQRPEQTRRAAEIANLTSGVERQYTNPHSRVPRTQLLSNGRYSVMVTAAGSGYSRWRDIAVTRWREDVTADNWGSYIFVRDPRTGESWSAGYQPSATEPDSYRATFSEDRAQIERTDGSVTTLLEVAISPEDDAEVRRISITNHGVRTRELDVTSFAELALARQADDVAHPAFAKLFVETEFHAELGAILATRRQRSSADPRVWAAHLAVVEGETSGDAQYETDRARFIGRGQTVRTAAGFRDGWPLNNTVGPVLDPVFSLRRRVKIPRGATVRIAFWTVVAPTRDEVIDLADKHHEAAAFERATTLAWTQAQMQLHHLGILPDEAHLFQRLANHVLYSDVTLRPASDVLRRGACKASTLWASGISGDLPIVLVQIEDDDDLPLVHQLLRAHEYWRLKQLAVDLVILNERAPSYAQDFQVALDALVRKSRSTPAAAGDKALGEVFVLRADLVPGDVRALLQTAARAVLRGSGGALVDQVNRARDNKSASAPPKRVALKNEPDVTLPRPPMEFFNGLGGFAEDGEEYVTILNGDAHTPAPWVNVIANRNFGFQVSTEGGGCTWAINSQQNLLTPWSNDPVGDAPGEAFYLRDEATGEVWTPTALPIREKASTYTARHGHGYSVFENASHGIAVELTQYVPVDDAVKISRLKITNQSGRERSLSLTAYVEWVLGTSRTATVPFVMTEIDPKTGAMFAVNPWSNDFGENVAFADMAGRQVAWTGDRTEFVGRDGVLESPIGLAPGAQLSNHVGPGLDPCAALQTRIRMGVVGSVEIVFFLGEAPSREKAQELLAKYRTADLDDVLNAVKAQWDKVLHTVQVKTPDRALDILVNRWLPYQALACRIWARTGFYQASGAYGFRDQLQDVMALCVSRPDIAREQLLRAAGRQFLEGDVQHWWLPETGRGIRTRVSDDRGWLAYVVAHYVNTTGDDAVLDEMIPFLEGPVLHDGERDAFFEPTVSQKTASLFDHCALALDKSLATGPHGLPLMGTGDWNDGMDAVGAGGKGESIWLGWFLHAALASFAKLAERRGAAEEAENWRDAMLGFKNALEKAGWDGDWYRRAYFDDGTPLGSVLNRECRIDSIAQSWGVISGAAEPARAARAMAAVDKYLVQRDDRLITLFTPPFENPSPDPGYIKGYPAGIRENGGQYTHGAAWAALAFAMLGDGDRCAELLSILNPINHASSPTGVHRYKVEPYVICADVYSMPPNDGRGGWTWYTGSAGWTYRVALEGLLGFRKQGSNLLLDPCIPKAWPSFGIVYRHGAARYDISVENPLGVNRGILAVKLDGTILTGKRALIPLVDDGATHTVQIVLG
ncbi:MAG TPA: glucoamylase family protein [Rhizomicrobium sp.]|nr:glucoamylase family protein [Rhizomicrobium sp.]